MNERGTVTIGRFFGIQVGLRPTWFLIFALVVWQFAEMFQNELQLTTAAGITFAVLTAVLLYASLLAHEYGHALTARQFGIPTERIILHLFGGVAYLRDEPKRPRDEFWITIAGPGVSLLLALFFGVLFLAARTFAWPAPLPMALGYLGGTNLILALFNFLPGFPMDGGRLLRSAIWAATGNLLLSTRIAAWGGYIVGALISLTGVAAVVFSGGASGILQVFLGLFLISLARNALKHAEFRAATSQLSVRQLMRPVNAVVPADTSVAELVNLYFQRIKVDTLPVVDGDRLLGFVAMDDAMTLEPRQWDWVRVREIVRPYDQYSMISPDDDAMVALRKLMQLNRRSVAVFKGRRLLGFVFDADLVHALRQAGAPMAAVA